MSKLQEAAAEVIELYANEVSVSPALRNLYSALVESGWTPKVKETIRHPQIKPGEPGFEWPACPHCGSRSLRCGCD